MATVQDLNAAFGELRNAEGRIGALFRKGIFLYERGRLTEDGRMMFAAARDDLYATEMRAYTFLTTAVGRIPGAADTAAAIPRPVKYPDLPPIPTAEQVADARARGVLGLGLGAVPAAAAVALNPWVLAAGVVVAVVLIAAVAWILVEYGDDIMAIMQFSIATSESGRRYDDCMTRGYTVAQCAAAHPGPTPAPGGGLPWYFWAVLGVGAAAVVGIGVYGYVKRKQVGAAFGAYKAASLTGPKTQSEPFKFALPARGQGG